MGSRAAKDLSIEIRAKAGVGDVELIRRYFHELYENAKEQLVEEDNPELRGEAKAYKKFLVMLARPVTTSDNAFNYEVSHAD